MIYNVLSCLGGYFNSNTFELDIPKIADISEMSEDELIQELNILQSNGDIELKDNTITLVHISSKKSKKFNDLWAPVETMTWGKNMKLKLDV